MKAKKSPAKSPEPLILQQGQLWKTKNDVVEIMQVGKLLAHYRIIATNQKRGFITIEQICVIQDYLGKNGGKLVEV